MSGIDAFTKLMLHFDGADGSTTFTDSSSVGRTVTPTGNAQIDTAQSKFGGASGLFDGAVDFLTCSPSADFNFGTGNFTIDFWVRFNASTRVYILDEVTNTAAIIITPSSGLVEIYGPASHVINTGSTPFSTGTWYHIALVRNGNSWVVYRNGVSYVTATDSRSWGSSAVNFAIGTVGGGGSYFNGWLDEFRVSKGIARWTTGFTPPTEAYSAVTYELPADAGSYAITGQTASLEYGREVAAAAGSYAISGQTASLERGYKVTALSGSYVLTGSDADLIVFGEKSISAEAGSYALTGQAASLVLGREVTAAVGSYSITGATASLEHGREVAAQAGSYTLNGQPVGLYVARHLSAAGGSYALTGNSASLFVSREVSAAAGAYALAGTEAAVYLQGVPQIAAVLPVFGAWSVRVINETPTLLVARGTLSPAVVTDSSNFSSAPLRVTASESIPLRVRA